MKIAKVISLTVIGTIASISAPEDGSQRAAGVQLIPQARAQESRLVWADWLTELNGIWELRDNSRNVRRVQLHFSKNLSVMDQYPMTILDQDPVAETVTFTYPRSSEPAAVRSLPVLRDPSGEQQQRLRTLGISVEDFLRRQPQDRYSLLDPVLSFATNRWKRERPQVIELEHRIVNEREKLQQLQRAGDPVAAIDLENQLRRHVTQLAKFRPSAEIAAGQLSAVDALIAELTDEVATLANVQHEAAAREASKHVEVTLRRVWNDARTGYHLAVFDPYSTSQASFIRRFRGTEIADMTALASRPSLAADPTAVTTPPFPARGRAKASPVNGKNASNWDDGLTDLTGTWRTKEGEVIKLLVEPSGVAMDVDNDVHGLQLTGYDQAFDFARFTIKGGDPTASWVLARMPSDDPKGYYVAMFLPAGERYDLQYQSELSDGERDSMLRAAR